MADTTTNITKDVQDLAKLMKSLGYDVEQKYLDGKYDDAFPEKINKSLEDFKAIAGIKGTVTPEELRSTIQAKALEMVIGDERYQGARIKAWHANSHREDLRLEAMRSYRDGKGLYTSSQADIAKEMKKEGMTDFQLKHIAGVIDFMEKADTYIGQIGNVEQHANTLAYQKAATAEEKLAIKKEHEKHEKEQQRLREAALAAHANKPDAPSDMQQEMMLMAIEFIAEHFPEALPMFDQITRMFSGGQGLRDLVPEIKEIPAVNEALGKMPLGKVAQLEYSFTKAFEEKSGDTDATRDAILKATQALSILPFGDKARREAFPKAVEKALDTALEKLNANPDDPANKAAAATLYADTFMAEMEALQSKDPTFKQGNGITVDPLLVEKFAKDGVDVNGDGKIGNKDIDTIYETYKAHNQQYLNDPSKQTPLLFKGDDGETYMAMVEKGSNYFTIQHLDIKGMDAVIEAGKAKEGATPEEIKNANNATRAELIEKFKGYEMARENHPHFFNEVTEDGIVTDLDMVSVTAKNIARPFDDVAKEVGIRQAKVIEKAQVENAGLKASGKYNPTTELIKQLDYAIEREAEARRDDGGSNIQITRAYEDEMAARSKSRSELTNGKLTGIEIKRGDVTEKEYSLHTLRDLIRTQNSEKEVVTVARNGNTNDPIYKNSKLEEAPQVFTNKADGTTYIFSKDNNSSHGQFFITDVTDELKRLKTMTPEERATYEEKDFNNLTAVAKQYGYKDIYAIEKLVTKEQAPDAKTTFNAAAKPEDAVKKPAIDLKGTFGQKAPEGFIEPVNVIPFSLELKDNMNSITGAEPKNVVPIDMTLKHNPAPAALGSP